MRNEDGNFLRKIIFRDTMTAIGFSMIFLLILIAVYAPFLANALPLAVRDSAGWSFPAFRELFAPDSPEAVVERVFNFLMIYLPFLLLVLLCRLPKRAWWLGAGACLLILPFLFAKAKPDMTDWRARAQEIRAQGGFVLQTPVPYGPFETEAQPYAKPCAGHWFGADHAGRDVLSRMIYGSRVSVAVGFAATAFSMTIGTFLGLFAGYKGGRTDLYTMRVVEIVICFPQFLLLLILMSILLDYGFRQSLLLVILVLGIFGWTGLCRLVRGETLKQRKLPYISAAEGLGLPTFQILFRHLLPNVSGPIFVTFAFDAAGAILAESFLSFLGFGVQDPTSSWGELMRQAFPDPVTYWHLTLWPGLAIFIAVCSFNFIGEGLRKTLG